MSARPALVALLAAGCAAAPPASLTTEALSGFTAGPAIWRGAASLVPCHRPLSVRLPVAYGPSAKPPAGTAYAIEGTLRVVDALGREARVQRRVQLRGAAALTFGWDGLVAAGAEQAPAAAGKASATLEVDLVSLRLDGGETARTVLAHASFASGASVGAAQPRCSAWAARIDDFGGDRVVVNGRPTTLRPRATWRNQRLAGLVGDLGRAQGDELEAVRAFVAGHADLFGQVAPAQLSAARARLDPSGVTRLVVEQRTRGGLRALDGRVTILFDRDRELIAINGAFLERLHDADLSFTFAESAALEVVRHDLAARGFDPATRAIAVAERVATSSAPASYQPAYLIDVGPGPSALPGTSPAPADPGDWETFAYVVSATGGTLLDVWSRTSPQSVSGSVSDVDLQDPTYLDPLLAPSAATPSPAPPTVVSSRTIRLDTPSMGDPFRLVDGDPAGILSLVMGAVTDQAVWDCPDAVCLIEPTSTTPAFSPPPATPPSAPPTRAEYDRAVHKSLLRGYHIIQDEWERHLAPWLGASPPVLLTLWSHDDLPPGTGFGSTPLGAYSAPQPAVGFPDGSIWLLPQLAWVLPAEPMKASARVAAHELFHHFDEITVALRRSAGSSHRMPTAIKEGMAELIGKGAYGVSPIDNTHHQALAGPFSALACLFSASWSCFDDLHDRFRVLAVGFYPYHRPTAQGRSVVEPWPDCRVESLVDCHVVRAPGQGGTYVWRADGLATHASQYELVAQTLLDAWESSTSAVAAGSSATVARTYGQQIFPRIVMGAFLTLPPDASLVDLWFAVGLQAWLDVSLTTVLPASVSQVPYAEIENAFERHGIDLDLWQLCNDPATSADCH